MIYAFNISREWASVELIAAVKNGNIEKLEELIKNGANANAKNQYSSTLLDIASGKLIATFPFSQNH